MNKRYFYHAGKLECVELIDIVTNDYGTYQRVKRGKEIGYFNINSNILQYTTALDANIDYLRFLETEPKTKALLDKAAEIRSLISGG